MTASVLALQPGRLDLGVNLRRGQAGVSQQLLDRPQVSPALQQMRGERMAQRMGRDPARDGGLADPALQPAAHVRRMEALAALRDKQGLLLAGAHESLPRTVEIAAEGR